MARVKTIGNTYIIDEGFTNSGEVTLIKIYGNHFCSVRDESNGEEWETMLYRLTEKSNGQTKDNNHEGNS